MRYQRRIRLQTLKVFNVSVGSKPEKLNESKCFPLCPRKQTSRYARGMSVSCHKRTHAPQQNYSITSSARTSMEGGTVRPSALAVFMLITSSNLVGCSTGRLEGLVPFRILST